MRVRIVIPTKDEKHLRERILDGAVKVEADETGEDEWEVVSLACTVSLRIVIYSICTAPKMLLIDPGQFRVINDILQKECKGKGRIETVSFAAFADS
jgi:ribosome maturation protein SDO1